jgi:hypothetical protein
MFGESPSILALAPRQKPHRISRRITEFAPDMLRSTPFEIAASEAPVGPVAASRSISELVKSVGQTGGAPGSGQASTPRLPRCARSRTKCMSRPGQDVLNRIECRRPPRRRSGHRRSRDAQCNIQTSDRTVANQQCPYRQDCAIVGPRSNSKSSGGA